MDTNVSPSASATPNAVVANAPMLLSSNQTNTHSSQLFEWASYQVQLESESNKILGAMISSSPHNIIQQTDEKGFTLMHLAVLAGVEGKVLALINLVKEH